MAMKPLRPCRHPGCSALVRDGYCGAHQPKRTDDRSEEAKSWRWMYRTDKWLRELRPEQLLRSPSAGSVPSEASEPGPPTWTTSWTTRVTGMCSVIRPTWRAFATAATVVKRRGNCGKTARKRNDAEAQNGASLGRWRAMRGASCGDPCTLPRGQKSFDPASVDRMPPFTRKIFPTGKCGRGCCGDASGSAWVLRGRSGAGPDAAGVLRG